MRDEWRGRGLGRRLVERAIAEAEAKRYEALYLLTTTAERYFPSFGFEPIERSDVPASIKATEEFRSACPASRSGDDAPPHVRYVISAIHTNLFAFVVGHTP